MRKKFQLILAIILLLAYFYDFSLCLWGKPLYGKTGHIEYMIIFHLLAVINYFTFDILVDAFKIERLRKRDELFFFLHGSLISVFPYSNYLLAGFILMAASLVTSGLKGKN